MATRRRSNSSATALVDAESNPTLTSDSHASKVPTSELINGSGHAEPSSQSEPRPAYRTLTSEDPRSHAPELSVRATSALLLYFEHEYGLPRLEELWRREKISLSLQYLKTPSNYISLGFLEELCDLLVRESGDPKFTRTAGLFTARPEAIGFAYHMLKAFGSPRMCYEQMITLSSTYNRVGEFSIERLEEREFTFTYLSHERELSRNICELRMGQFSSFPMIWRLAPAHIEELQCQVNGAACCRYHMTWQNPIRSWRYIVGLALGAASGLVASKLGTAALPDSVVLLSLVGGLLGAWLDARNELRRKDEYLLAQNKGLADSARDLQRRYEEVYKSNIQLEQRVRERTKEISEAKDKLEEANQKLEVALAKQRELDKLKTQFFDNVSHELRTPLTLILLSLESLLRNNRSDVPATLRHHLETIDRSAARLLRLINDLLDLAKIEAGKTRLRYESIDLISFLKSVLLPFHVLAEQKRIRLSLEGAEGTPILADAEKIDVVFQNLISNALKFTSDGGEVTVRVSEDSSCIFVEIADTGVGISPKDLGMIFDRFAQADSTGIRRFGGTGIGLSLVKETVEIHGGNISVTSTPGKGSSFRIALPKGTAHIREELRERRADDIPVWRERRAVPGDPLGKAKPLRGTPEKIVESEQPPDETSPGEEAKKKILVVEDDPAMRRFLVNILRQQYRVVEAGDGSEALRQTAQQRPDLVLSDVVMPVMSGLQLTNTLKSTPETSDLPVILLTARGEADNAVYGLSCGANDYIGKPFAPRELLARIETQLRLREAALRVAENERLAAVGLLTSGFAHEVRNPLNGLLNALGPLRKMLEAPQHSHSSELVQIMEDCGQRIAHLAESLLQFARPSGKRTLVDVCGSLEKTVRVLKWRTPADVQLEWEFRCTEPVVGDAAALNQVWLNLVDNALRAVGKTGKILIATEVVEGDLVVTVTDSGPGIPKEHVGKIFEPFFSTRPAGEGSGLGLAISRRIVNQHGGSLSVFSELGKGTRFAVALPMKDLGTHPFTLSGESAQTAQRD
jgi:signal transduction histidine kinase